MQRLMNVVLVLLFSIVLVLPTMAGWVGLEPMKGLNENRPLAQEPASLLGASGTKVAVNTLAAAAQQWEKYYTDNFGLRKLLIGSYRFLTVHGLGVSLHPAVVIGSVGAGSRWYFYNGSAASDGAGLESLSGSHPYTPDELAMTAANIEATSKLLEANGVKFLLMIPPDKQTLYPEFLPRGLRPPPGAVSRLAQFWSATKPSLERGLIDLREPFFQQKSDRQLYLATDTHWNDEGAFAAYQIAIRALQFQDHGPPPLERSDTTWKGTEVPHSGDCTVLMGLPTLGETEYDIVLPSKEAFGRPRGHKILVLSDSFFGRLHRYFAFEFDEVVVLSGVRSAKLVHIGQDILNSHHPDVVLLEVVERYWTY